MIDFVTPVTTAAFPGIRLGPNPYRFAALGKRRKLLFHRPGGALRGVVRSRLGVALVLLLTSLPAQALQAAEAGSTASAPFVGAFERLARHDEIDSKAAGRLLISELSCVACHASDDRSLWAKGGPDLRDAGTRLNPDWVARFVANPSSVKPGTTMPDLLHDRSTQERGRIAAALSAYLASLRRPLREIKGTGAHPVPHAFWNLGDVDRGRTLYHRIGCVACHAPDPQHETVDLPASPTDHLLELLDPDELEELGLASAARSGPIQPLGDLADQYSLRSLTLFLLDPEVTRPGGRMPNFKLTAVDAADIASYLMQRFSDRRATADFSLPDQSPAEERTSELVAEGRKQFIQLQCASCHTSDVDRPKPAAPALAQLDGLSPRGCLASSVTANGDRPAVAVPRFGLDALQTEAIARALADESTPDAHQRLGHQMLQLNCYACHERDGLGGISRDRRAYFETVAHEDLGDEGRLPPPLSAVGRKALPAWLNRVLQGNGDIRPHMHARMPKFPAAAVKQLGALLAEVDRAAQDAGATGVALVDPARPESMAMWSAEDEQQFEVGRSLMDAGCVQCHTFRGEALPGVVGVDLRGIADRVEPEWFHEFLFNPGAVKERTRMPNFFPDGKSQNPALLGGDAHRQIAAMWGYLKTLSKQPLPAKIEEARSKDFELKPIDRPILIRTFMREAGTHAIAVGFPEQVHFALDAQSLRLASAWRGRFLDAQGTWFVRSAPPADPLGTDLIAISDDDLFVFSPTDAEQPPRRFLGFRLDDQGVPTFSYSIGRLEIDDRITPLVDSRQAAGDSAPRFGLRRQLRLRYQGTSEESLAQPLPTAIRLLSGRQLTPLDNGAVQNEHGLMVSLPEAMAEQSVIRSQQGKPTWLLPLESNDTDRGKPRLRWKREQGSQPEATEDNVIEMEVRYQW